MQGKKKILALSGGVGGAKLVLGLSKILEADELFIVANTADDFEHLGLAISPDLDTVMYTLAGINNLEQGWGLANESWQMMDSLAHLGGDSWFRLGDKDIATHLLRTDLLRQGNTLTSATGYLCKRLNIKQQLLPMTDDHVSTFVNTDQGELAFQHYFVKEQCQPSVISFRFQGVEKAKPQNTFWNLLHDDDLAAIIICPSNPFVSIDPILKLNGVYTAMKNTKAPVIAVSPIVSGMAIKGPAAKMMSELSIPSTAVAVAQHYADLLDGFVIDNQDYELAPDIEAMGISVDIAQSIMNTLEDRVELGDRVLRFANTLSVDCNKSSTTEVEAIV